MGLQGTVVTVLAGEGGQHVDATQPHSLTSADSAGDSSTVPAAIELAVKGAGGTRWPKARQWGKLLPLGGLGKGPASVDSSAHSKGDSTSGQCQSSVSSRIQLCLPLNMNHPGLPVPLNPAAQAPPSLCPPQLSTGPYGACHRSWPATQPWVSVTLWTQPAPGEA